MKTRKLIAMLLSLAMVIGLMTPAAMAEEGIDTAEKLKTAISEADTGDTITLSGDISASEIITIDKAITLEGNGKTLTSTAGRAINVETGGNVTIQNLTINASGERAINVINKPVNLTVNNVTATAANYAVMIATSAADATVSIQSCDLTGLNVVNVAGEGAKVTISATDIVCDDQNENENYGAIALYQTAVNAEVTVTGGTITVNGDSLVVANSADGGVVNISSSTAHNGVVEEHVAVIDYPNNYAYSFATVQDAIDSASEGETVKLVRNVTASEIITIDKAITLEGNGKTLTSTAGRAINVETDGNVTIQNLTINASGERAINVINEPVNLTVSSVTATAANYAVMIATSAGAATVAITDSDLTGLNAVNVAGAGAKVTISATDIVCDDQNENENYGAIALYQTAVGAEVTVTGGTITVNGDSLVVANSADGGVVNISSSTAHNGVVEEHVAVIDYPNNYAYSFATVQDAIDSASEGETVKLVRNVTEDIVISGSTILDLNSKTLTGTITLADVQAALTAPEGMTVATNVAGYEVVYSGGTYTVAPIAVTGVTLNKSTLSLTVGGNETLTATVAPDNAVNKSVTWTSSNESVATVDSNGKVTAVAAGTATITVTTTDGSFTATCNVTVTNPSSGGNSGGSSSGGSSSGSSSSGGASSATTGKGDDGIKVTVTAAAANAAAKKDEPVTLPVEVEAAESAEEAVEISVNVPKNGATVEIPVENVTPGTVVIIVNADGTESVVPLTTLTEDGVVVTLEDDATIKVVDNSKDFVDVPDEYALADSIDFVSARGLFEGTTETTFTPYANTTIAQTMTVLARLSGEDFYGAGSTTKGAEWATEKGLSDGTDVSKAITREQMVMMMWKLAGMPESDQVLTASDVNDISSDALTAMQWAVEMGILKGNLDGTLNPNGNASRAHVAAFAERYVNVMAK